MTAQVGMDQLLNCFAGSSAPSSPTTGQLWYDTGSSALKVYNGSSWSSASGGGSGTNVQVFDSSGTFTVPTGVTSLVVTVFGGGGGGGGGAIGSSANGGFGGFGGAGKAVITGLTPGSSVTVTVGAGGTGGNASPPGTSGGSGGTSSFGLYISCTGGGGGTYATGGSDGQAGAPGSCTTTGTILQKNTNITGTGPFWLGANGIGWDAGSYFGGAGPVLYSSLTGLGNGGGGGSGMSGGGSFGLIAEPTIGPLAGGQALGPGANGGTGNNTTGAGGAGGGTAGGSAGANSGSVGASGGGGTGGVIVEW